MTMLMDQEEFALRTPAHRFNQGGRDVYSFPLELETLNRLLPERVNEGVAYEANRRLTPSHAKKIQDYLESQQKWVSGTVMLGIDPESIEFIVYGGQPEGAAIAAGELCLRGNPRETMKLFDGQHRRRAIADALKHLDADNRRKDRLITLLYESVPVILYAESDIKALQQMFGDAAQTKSIERNTVAQFDKRDAFNQASETLTTFSEFLSGRVEFERSTVARNTPKVISINQLVSTLKTVDVGIRGRVSKERNDEYLLDNEDLVERCSVWADQFLPATRQEYDDLISGEIDDSEIPDWRNKSMAFNAVMLKLLAGCYHEWVKDDPDWQPLADYLRAADLKPGSHSGSLLVDAGLVLPGGITPISRVPEMERAIDYIVHSAKNQMSDGN